MKETKRITMNQESFSKSLSHLLTFAQETQQSTEANGVITLKPTPELPKLEYVGHCLTSILSSCANATGIIPYERSAIAEMLEEDVAYHFRQKVIRE